MKILGMILTVERESSLVKLVADIKRLKGERNYYKKRAEELQKALTDSIDKDADGELEAGFARLEGKA